MGEARTKAMAKKQPTDLISLFESAYTKEHGFDRHDPSDEWFGLTCRVSRIEGEWNVKVASFAGAPFMNDAFEGTGDSVEKAFAEALHELIAKRGQPPRPKTRHELEMEKFNAGIESRKRDAEAAKSRKETPPPGSKTPN